ncbi:gas vesicle protein [Streptomyces sp. ISL-99]|uniref:gas vesicle protein GvpO n=1 Tax=Streptomyces sp. ISL-99 TaxID=2819193 RepID=UPI001BE7ABB2|nr:gas vesicle protein [Streptomyces sp. ISL-99]MBT2528615.1 gas vesicle protein [Streptomyces sp. ISL-99]
MANTSGKSDTSEASENKPKNDQSSPSKTQSNKTQSNKTQSNKTQSNKTESLPGPMDVLRGARAQLAELTGMEAESVSSFERMEDDGWMLRIEVLELARVPDTMSLLASYEVTLDAYGALTGYRRVRRYERGRADRS